MKFNNRFYYLLFGAFTFFSLAKGLEILCDKESLMQQHAQTISNDLQEKEQKIAKVLSDQSSRLSFNSLIDIDTIGTLSKEKFGLFVYNNDSLIFWSNNSIPIPNKELINELKYGKGPLFKRLSNGYYAVQKNKIPQVGNSTKFTISAIPIKWVYTSSLKHLDDHFEANNKHEIPNQIEVISEETPFPIIALGDHTLAYLSAPATLSDKPTLRWLLLLYLLGFVSLGLAINIIAKKIIKNNKPWIGPAFLLITVFGLRYLSLDWSTKFEEFQVFSRSFDNPTISVGDLLINIVLLLWVVIFIHKESKNRDFTVEFSPNTRFFLTTMNYLSVVLALLLLISVLKSLVLNSGIDFDFKNVFSLDQYSVIAVFGVILLLFTQFVFSHRMMITIHKLKLNRTKRLMALCTAIIFALPIIFFIDLQIPIFYTALLAFIFVMAYDLYIDIPDPGLVWLSAWVILFAGFSSSLLYKYNTDKELNKEIAIAKQLSIDVDTLAEESIINFKNSIDQAIQSGVISSPYFLQSNSAKAFFSTLNFNQNYLYSNYNYELNGYDEEGQIIGDNVNSKSLNDWQKVLTSAQPIDGHSNIFLSKDVIGNPSYILLKKFPNIATGTQVPQLIIAFNKAARKQSKVYTNLLTHQEFKGLKALRAYDYAIVKNATPIIQQGMFADEPNFTEVPAVNEHVKMTQGESVFFMYRSAENEYVLLKKPKNNLFHPISLFSFIFGFLLLMVILVAAINSKFDILPDNLNFQFWNKPSLKNRIQFSIILLTIAIFLVIAVVSVYFLTDSYSSYDKSRLSRKVSGVQTSAEQYLHQANDSLDLLSDYVEDLAKAERIDFNLFDLKGQLIQSSEIDIFDRGVLSPKMNAYAFEFLRNSGKSDIQIAESISTQTFTSAFTTIANSGGQTIAYVGVPYRNQQRTKNDDVVNFLGNLVNVYVSLLILAAVISIRVAEKITKPITTIGENLKEIKLGKSNEPLEWKTNDEIGALVGEYNRMIVKLEHSAKLLARSEREGAWREMAKQVAHEIKNPLTPMKLSIQYLQHAFRSNPENIESLMKRVATTLIEQIDSLAQIADEFSNFAKMPRANNQQLKLNDLVESVHDLFKESKNTEINLSLPGEPFYVFADRNHLVRVLNNMIKNAVEAIPDSRAGKIDVTLTQEDNMAVIKVIDNGVGIPDEMKERVFVPNFTTKNSGTGLGLAISKNIIESVNGTIYFETEKDVGTTFFVKLPLEDMVLDGE